MSNWQQVGRALLGRWPSQVANWGEEGIAAFVEELQAEGLSAEQALDGVRLHRSEFPPSVSAVSDNARNDPSTPTFEETYQLIYGRGGVLRALPPYSGPDSRTPEKIALARSERIAALHPMAASFIHRYGLDRLSMLEVDHPEYGELKRKELREAWDRHCEAMEGRDVAALVSGERKGQLGKFDPLAALGLGARQLERGESA